MALISDKIKRRLYFVAGSIAAGLGIAGIVLPVLPTTPFLLLAAYCYKRSSPRFYDALLRNRFLGGYLRDYLEGRGMSLGKKMWTLSVLWAAIVLTGVLATDSLIVRIILAAVLIRVTIHILRIKTARSRA